MLISPFNQICDKIEPRFCKGSSHALFTADPVKVRQFTKAWLEFFVTEGNRVGYTPFLASCYSSTTLKRFTSKDL
jgi:hypothetical protein